MSETGQTKTAPSGRSDVVIIGLLAAAVIGALIFFASDDDRVLRRSATGFTGLVSWLKANDVEARTFAGGGQMLRDSIGLRILPIFDTDLREDRERPGTREEVIASTTEADLGHYVVQRKIRDLPTVVVLPKWRAGMRLLGVAHEDLLIPAQEINRLLRQVDEGLGQIRRDPEGWRTYRHGRRELGLLHAQTMPAGGCTPLIGTEAEMLLGLCPASRKDGDDETHFWLLTDPDLANNHGLRWAANAEALLEAITSIQRDGPVILDTSRGLHTVERDWRAERRDRTWDDFMRMFAWPFTMIWIAFAAVGALVLWRAVTRYGPLARIYDDEPHASKEVSINAKARLLRLADHDAALLVSHIRDRLAHLASDVLGPHRAPDRTPLEALTQLISRRDPALAQELAAAADLPANTQLGPAEILRRLDRFETCYDKVTYEFGRTEQRR